MLVNSDDCNLDEIPSFSKFHVLGYISIPGTQLCEETESKKELVFHLQKWLTSIPIQLFSESMTAFFRVVPTVEIHFLQGFMDQSSRAS
jgi:hypothetical protein